MTIRSAMNADRGGLCPKHVTSILLCDCKEMIVNGILTKLGERRFICGGEVVKAKRVKGDGGVTDGEPWMEW